MGMRMWHYKLLDVLPELQFRGQLRELVAICSNIQQFATPRHLLVNILQQYPPEHLATYIDYYISIYEKWYGKKPNSYDKLREFIYDFLNVKPYETVDGIYSEWHNREYLRVCMANLYEKFAYSDGKSKISESDWKRLTDRYLELTGHNYII
jgi:uncharacterized protein (TIGR02328 family)